MSEKVFGSGVRGRRRRRVLPLLVVLMVTACQEDCEEAGPFADLTSTFGGTVYVNDAPRAGVRVSNAEAVDVTDENGRYTLSGLFTATVRASAPGVTFLGMPVAVLLPTSGDVDIRGYTDAAVRGRVLLGSMPVPGATVRLSGAGFDEEATAGENGEFAFVDVPPSDLIGYSLSVTSSHPGGYWTGIFGTLQVRGRDVSVDLVGTVLGTGIHGTVSWNGTGLPGVTVTARGPVVVTRITDARGEYQTGSISSGEYEVSISGYDAAAYPFDVTSRAVTLTGIAEADFAGRTNQPPVATIVGPEDGATGYAGAAVTLVGEGSDPEDGALPDAALAWSSNVDGPLGTGAMATPTLSPGTHTISLAVRDAVGAADTARITIQIVQAPSNASISGRVTGNGYGVGGAVVSLSGPVSMTTTSSGEGGAYAFTGLPPGVYTLTVSTELNITFPNRTQTVTLAPGQALTVDFAGTY